MKLINSIAVVIMAYSAIYLSLWVVYEFENDANKYNVTLTMYSDYILRDKNLEDWYIVQFNEDNIQDYPILFGLITQIQLEAPQVNSFSYVASTFDEVKKETQYFRSKFLEKYPGALPDDIYSIEEGHKFNIYFKEKYFIYDDTFYHLSDRAYFKNGVGKITLWKTYSPNSSIGNNLVVTLTDQDLKEMPRFKEGLDQVGNIEYNTYLEKKMSELEFKKFEQFAIDIGIADEKVVFHNAVIEFQDKYYSIGLKP